MTTQEDKARFERDGDLVVEGVLEGGLLEQVRREAQALADAAPPDAASRPRHNLSNNPNPRGESHEPDEIVGNTGHT